MLEKWKVCEGTQAKSIAATQSAGHHSKMMKTHIQIFLLIHFLMVLLIASGTKPKFKSASLGLNWEKKNAVSSFRIESKRTCICMDTLTCMNSKMMFFK